MSDSIILFLGALLGTLYLVFRIAIEPEVVYRHSLVVLYLFFLGFISLDYLIKGKKILIAIALLFSLMNILFSLTNGAFSFYNNTNNNLLSTVYTYDKKAIESMYKIRNVIIPLIKNKKVHFLIDSSGPSLVVTAFDKIDFSVNDIWDNLGVHGNIIRKQIDIIILSKKANGFKDENEYIKSLENLSLEKRKLKIEDSNLRRELVNSHTIFGSKFDLVYEDEYSYVFIKDTFLLDSAQDTARGAKGLIPGASSAQWKKPPAVPGGWIWRMEASTTDSRLLHHGSGAGGGAAPRHASMVPPC